MSSSGEISLQCIITSLIHDKTPNGYIRILRYLIGRVYPIMRRLPNVCMIKLNNTQLIQFGDLHGTKHTIDLLSTLNLSDGQTHLLVNGDMCDRGHESTETVMVLFAYFIHGNVTLLRGNHELSKVWNVYGFHKEIKKKFDIFAIEAIVIFKMLFEVLPLAAIIEGEMNERYLSVHGGPPFVVGMHRQYTIDEINSWNRFQDDFDPTTEEGFAILQMLWNDPRPITGLAPSNRGVGLYYGEDALRQFLIVNNLKFIIRSHELVESGYNELWKDASGVAICSTLFSSPNYGGPKYTNVGGILQVNSNLHINYYQFGNNTVFGDLSQSLSLVSDNCDDDDITIYCNSPRNEEFTPPLLFTDDLLREFYFNFEFL